MMRLIGPTNNGHLEYLQPLDQEKERKKKERKKTKKEKTNKLTVDGRPIICSLSRSLDTGDLAGTWCQLIMSF